MRYTMVIWFSEVDYCIRDSATCRNGGTCVSGNDGHTCRCVPSFSGPECEGTAKDTLLLLLLFFFQATVGHEYKHLL